MTHEENEIPGIIFSFQQMGGSMKITASCEKTLIEVSVIAPISLPQADMQLLAFRKLQHMISKQA
jgi:hypothetical protein